MTTSSPNTDTTARRTRLSPAVMLGLLAVLAPLGYLVGRISTELVAGTYLTYLTSGVAATALGVMAGIPIGLFFGSLRTTRTHAAASVSTPQMELSILEQLRAELVENKALFEARRGSITMFARIAYITSFWSAIKASGRLFVMQDAELLGVIASSYYWLDQASHLELLAYDAKYASEGLIGSEARATKLINEARLLDGQIGSALEAAITSIDNAVLAIPKA